MRRSAVQPDTQILYEWSILDDAYAMSGDPKDLVRASFDNPEQAHNGAVAEDAINADDLIKKDLGLPPAAQESRRAAILGVPDGQAAFALTYPANDDAVKTWPHGWIEERGLRIFDADGTVNRVVGVLRPLASCLSADGQEKPARGDETLGKEPQASILGRAPFLALLNSVAAVDRPCALLVVGIDDLAMINMAYGLSVADEIIDAVGLVLLGVTRAHDRVARVSGAKFAVLLDGCDAQTMTDIAHRMLTQVRSMPIMTSSGTLRVTVSLGGVAQTDGDLPIDHFLSAGEEALSKARNEGGDGLAVHHQGASDGEVCRAHQEMAQRIVACLNQDRVVLAFQPIISCETGQAEQWECLARLIDEEGAPLPAAEFIPVAEHTGLVRRIDLRVLSLALDHLSRVPHLRLAVNISGSSMGEPEWLENYVRMLEDAGEAVQRLTVELTEYARIDNVDYAALFVSRLQSLGCTVAIDDFGAGYTSFRNLQRLAVNVVKIDGSFIRNLSKDRDNQVFTGSLIDLARKIGLKTVAECVDSDEDVSLLKRMGADYLQGFHLGRPTLTPLWATVDPCECPAA